MRFPCSPTPAHPHPAARLARWLLPFCLPLTALAVQIADSALPAAVIQEPYPTFYLTATSGSAPFTWSIASGSLPPGLTLQPSGQITGTATATASVSVTFRVTDAGAAQATRALTQNVVNPPVAGNQAWDRRGLLAGYIYEVRTSPNYATDNTVFAHGRGADLYRSTDRGASWSRHDLLNGVIPGYVSYNDLTLPPNYLYTTNPAAQPESEKTVFAVYNYVVLKSTDHGNSFTQIHCDNTNSRCLNIALSPSYASNGTLYALVETGASWPYGYELHRSTDRGANWTLLHTFIPDRTLTQFLEIAPDGLTMFLRAYSNSLTGYRVFKSTDGGTTWNVTPAFPGPDAFYQIAVSPTYATDQTVVLRTSGTGVNYLYVSRNGGGSWQQLTHAGFSDRFSELTWTARPAQVPLLSFYTHHQPSGRYSLLVSDDRGVTFVPKFTAGVRPTDSIGGLGFGASPLLAGGAVDYFFGSTWGLDGSVDGGFSFTPHEAGIDAAWSGGWGTLGSGSYAGYSALGFNGWFKTADSGLSWVRMPGAGNGLPSGAQSVTPFFPPNYNLDRTLFLRWNGALYRSTDGGVTSSVVLNAGANDIAFAPNFRASGGTMFAATSSGLFKSTDGGLNFNALSSATGSCTFLANDYTPVVEISSAYAFDQAVFTINFNSSQSLCVSRDGGATWTARYDPPTIFNDFTLSPVYDDRAAAGTQQRMIYSRGDASIQVEPMRSTDGGVTFIPVSGIPAGLQYNIPFPSPAIVLDTTVLMASSAGIYRSQDNGGSYFRLNGGGYLNYRGATSIYFAPGFNGNLTSNSAAVVLADGAGIWRSTDGGRFFSPSGGEAFVSNSLNGLAIVPSTAAIPVVLAATGDEGVFRSDDGGISFANISPGLPAHSNTTAVVAPGAQPARPIAAKSADGLWRFNNATSTWSRHPTAGSGDYRAFGEDGTWLYAMRRDGVSLRSTDGGATWSNQDASKIDLVNVDYNSVVTPLTVANGNFETPPAGATFVSYSAGQVFGNWTVESGTVDHIGGLWTAASGLQSVDMNGGAPGAIYQDLATTAGKTYTLRFALAGNYGCTPGVRQLQVFWGGVSAGVFNFDSTGHSPGSMGWAYQQLNLTASSGTTRLRFVSLTAGACGPALDDVNVSLFGSAVAGKNRIGSLPWLPEANAASLWAVSQSIGPQYSNDNAATWLGAPGIGDYALPGGQIYTTIVVVGLSPVTGGRIVLAGTTTGLFKSDDGGASWRNVSLPGSGLEASSKNFTAMLSAQTPSATTDILVGATGATTGGVYLSGDSGDHWTQVNQGFDPNSLNITTLVKTSCSGCPVQYYTGTYGSGVYTRTIPVLPAPTITGWCFGAGCNAGSACVTTPPSGPEQGGQPFKLCGANFQNLAAVTFDGLAASGCVFVNSTAYTCTATPPHFPGAAVIALRNPDTRSGNAATPYTYASGAPRVTAGSLKITKSGNNAQLAYTCTGCTNPMPQVYRSQNVAFTVNVELYTGGATSYTNTGALAAGANPTYFWSVE